MDASHSIALIPADDQARLAKLTRRQRDVLVFTSKGLTRQAVGRCLGLTESTVASYQKILYRKLDVTGAVEAAVLAAKAGLV